MHIESIELKNFGCLRDRRLELAPGLNVIKGPNEAGKSTLQAAILTAFFVKPDTTARDVLARQSWGTQEKFRLALDLATGEGRLRLEKDFQARSARLTDTDTGSVIADLDAVQTALQEDLRLGTQALFESTACIPQEQIADIESGREQVTELLERQVTGADDAIPAEQALRDLSEEIRKLSVGLHDTEPKRPGPIRRLRDEIARLADQVRQAEAGLGGAEEARRAYEQTTREAETLGRDLAVKRSLRDKARQRHELERALAEATARRDELDERLAAIEECQQRQEEVAQRAHGLSRIAREGPSALERIRQLEADAHAREQEANRADADFARAEEAEAASPPPVPIFNPVTIAGLVLVAAAAAAGLVHTWLWAVVLAGGLGLALWGLLRAQRGPAVDYVQIKAEAAKRAHGAHQASQQNRETARSLLAELGCESAQELHDQVEQAQAAQSAAAQLRAELRGLLHDQSPAEIKQEFRRVRREHQDLQDRLAGPELQHAQLSSVSLEGLGQEIADAEARLAELQRQAQDSRDTVLRADVDPEQVSARREHLRAMEQRLQAHERRLAVYELARQAIGEARDETLRQATDVLAPRLGQLLSPLTAGRYAQVEVDETNMEIRVCSAEKDGSIAVGAAGGARRRRTAQSEMSAGTRGQVFLAARLALVDLIWPQDRPPLLLDDPLVSFDQERQRAAAAILKEYAQEGQVLLFTCSDAHDSFADIVIEL